jgi:hypothetical protein
MMPHIERSTFNGTGHIIKDRNDEVHLGMKLLSMPENGWIKK